MGSVQPAIGISAAKATKAQRKRKMLKMDKRIAILPTIRAQFSPMAFTVLAWRNFRGGVAWRYCGKGGNCLFSAMNVPARYAPFQKPLTRSW